MKRKKTKKSLPFLITFLFIGIVAVAVGIAFATSKKRGGGLPASPPPASLPTLEMPLMPPQNIPKEIDSPSDVSVDGKSELRANHKEPMALLKSYYQAVNRGDVKALTECYIPERRRGVAGLLSLVPRKIDLSGIRYEMVYLDNENAVIAVKGNNVMIDGHKRDLDEKVKLKKVRGYWYLEDM